MAKVSEQLEQVNRKYSQEHAFTAFNPLQRPYPSKLPIC